MDDIINHQTHPQMSQPEPSPPRRVTRVRHELAVRPVTVAGIRWLSPQLLALQLAGDALRSLITLSFDDHVKLLLPGPDGAPIRRDYTPRHLDADAGLLWVEFAIHRGGAASDWAAQARLGDPLSVAGPRGSQVIDPDHDWHLLMGDDSALPAIRRRLEELPAGLRVQVLARVDDPADLCLPPSRAQVAVQHALDDGTWLRQLADWALPAGEGFAWCAGEARTMAQARTLLQAKGHPTEASRVAAYWKQGQPAHHEPLAG